MASQLSSQASQPPDSSYPSQSDALRGQCVWVSPEFGVNEDMYRWIVECHGAELVGESGDRETFHLLPKFSGDTFVTLAEEGLKIVAVPCLAACIKDGCPLPSIEDEEQPGRFVPIFSRALEGQFVATSRLSAPFRKNIRTMVLLSCGCYQSVLNSQTTVLITKRNASEKYFEAARHKIPIVTPQWLRDVFSKSQWADPKFYLLPCFLNLTFSVTGFTTEERQKLSDLITTHGGKFSPALTKSCTHLIVDPKSTEEDSKKLKYALQWKQKLVSPDWLDKCTAHEIYCPSDDSTAHLLPSSNETSPLLANGSESVNNGLLPSNSISDFNHSLGFSATPLPNALNKGQAQRSGTYLHPTISVSGRNQEHTRVTQVSVRQSHFDIRSNLSNRKELSHTVDEEEEVEALEGDSPDDVDEDSEDEGNENVVVQMSQVPNPNPNPNPNPTPHEEEKEEDEEEEDEEEEEEEEKEEEPSHELEMGRQYEEDQSLKPPNDAPSIPIDFHILDADTQASVQSEALNVYFTDAFKDEEPLPQPLPATTKPSAPTFSYAGLRIVILGCHQKDDKGEIISPFEPESLKSFEDRGGVILEHSLVGTATHIVLVGKPPHLTLPERAIFKRRSLTSELVDDDWLLDTILLEVPQDPASYRLVYKPEDGSFIVPSVGFVTSSCVPAATGTTQQKSDTPGPFSPYKQGPGSPINGNGHQRPYDTAYISSAPSTMAGILIDSSLMPSQPSPSTTMINPLSSPRATNLRLSVPKSPSSNMLSRPTEGIRIDPAASSNPKTVPLHLTSAAASSTSPQFASTATHSFQRQLQSLQSRNIQPPTTVSTSNVLVKSAATVASIRKIEKNRGQEAQWKREKAAKEEQAASTSSKGSVKAADPKKSKSSSKEYEGVKADDPSKDGAKRSTKTSTVPTDPITAGSHAKKPSHTTSTHQKATPHSKDAKSSTRQDSFVKPAAGPEPRRNPTNEMDADDYDQMAVRPVRKLVFEDENDTIIASPLAVGNRALMMDSKKRKSPSSDRKAPILEVHSVKRRSLPQNDATELIPPAPLPLPPLALLEPESNPNGQYQDDDAEIIARSNRKEGGQLSDTESNDSSPPFIFPASMSSYGDSMVVAVTGHGANHGKKSTGTTFAYNFSQMIEPSPTVVHPRHRPAPSFPKPSLIMQSMRPATTALTAEQAPYSMVSTRSPDTALDSLPDDSPDLLEAVRLHAERMGSIRRVPELAPPEPDIEEEPPVTIMLVDPARGSKSGGDSVVITLDRVNANMRVVFGQVDVDTYCHPRAPKLWAFSPPSAVSLSVQISIIDNAGRRINANTDATFMYI